MAGTASSYRTTHSSRSLTAIVFALLLCHHLPLKAQHFTVEGAIGYNAFRMNTLKAIQDEFIRSLAENGIHAKAVQKFPAYYNLEVGVWYRHPIAGNFGILADYTTTGGRVAYSDYSGQLWLDQVAERRSVGLSYERRFLTRENISVALSLQSWLSWSAMRFSEGLIIGNSPETGEVKTKTTPAVAIQPGVHVAMDLQPVCLGLRASYYTEAKHEFTLESNSDATLTFRNAPVRTEWDALRIEFVVGVNLFTFGQ